MEIEVMGLGTVPYEDKDLLNFETGLYGFDKLHKYLPIPLEAGSDRMMVLQNIEEPAVSFILMNPFMFIKDYEPVPDIEDVKAIGSPKDEDISYYVICSLKKSIAESTINLKCPIAVNANTKQAIQLILDNPKYTLRHRVGDFKRIVREDADAGSSEKKG